MKDDHSYNFYSNWSHDSRHIGRHLGFLDIFSKDLITIMYLTDFNEISVILFGKDNTRSLLRDIFKLLKVTIFNLVLFQPHVKKW